jgi:hypothetical protein
MTKRSWFTSLRSRLMLVVGAALVPALILFIAAGRWAMR